MDKLMKYPKPNYMKLKGRVKIELFDAESGELVNKFEDDNVVLQYPYDIYFKEAQRTVMLANWYANQSQNNFSATVDTPFISFSTAAGNQFQYLVLTDSNLPTSSPEDECTWPGKTIGWCNLYNNSDVLDPQRGTISPSESYFDEKGFHFVFTFGSTKGNCPGSAIYSVCWMYHNPISGNKYNTNHPIQRKLYDVVRDVNIGKSTINEASLDIKYYGGTPGGSDGFFYGRRQEGTAQTIFKFKLDGTNLNSQYTIGTPNQTIGDFVIVGDYTVFCNGYADTGLVYLRRYDGEETTLNLNSAGTFNVKVGAVGTDGTNLYVVEYTPTGPAASIKMLRCNLATDLGTWNSPGTTVLTTREIKTITPDSSFNAFHQNSQMGMVLRTVSGVWDGFIYLSTDAVNTIAAGEAGIDSGVSCRSIRTIKIDWDTAVATDLKKSWVDAGDYQYCCLFLGPEEKVYYSKYLGSTRTNIYLLNTDTFNVNLLARRVLVAPGIEKTSANTMRVTYDITFEDTQSTVGWG